jgi:hypothetical protein
MLETALSRPNTICALQSIGFAGFEAAFFSQGLTSCFALLL